MATTFGFKDIIDLPMWRPLAVAPNVTAAGVGICSDLRNNEDRHPQIYQIVSNAVMNTYNVKNDGWALVGNPGLAGTFGAGAGCVFAPQRGPRGTLAGGNSTTKVVISTALPAAVGTNQLADRGATTQGFKIRIIGNTASGSGKTEERYIVANSSGTAPTLVLDSALSFTPTSGDAYEFLTGRIYLLGAGTTAAGSWKYHDVLTGAFSGNLATSGLAATIGTDFAAICLDELYVPADLNPGDGFFGTLIATAMTGTTLTGMATAGDFAVLANEWRNFQIRIVQDTGTPAAVGQRRKITSHTAGASPVYTVPTWTTTPSATASYVIEGSNEILLFSSATTNTYTYAQDAIAGGQSADTWSTSTYGTRPAAMAAGCCAFWPFGIATTLYATDVDKNFRYSRILSFRGGNVTTLDALDIAAAAAGTWTGAVTYGNSGPLFTTGTCLAYDGTTRNGRHALVNQNGGQTFFKFNAFAMNLKEYAQLRFTQGAAIIGGRMASAPFIDGTDKMGFFYYMRATGAELFHTAHQR